MRARRRRRAVRGREHRADRRPAAERRPARHGSSRARAHLDRCANSSPRPRRGGQRALRARARAVGGRRAAVVGAPKDHVNRGAAWTFADVGGGLAVDGPKLVGPQQSGESYFGRSVALSAAGATALVGAPGEEGHAGSAGRSRTAATDGSRMARSSRARGRAARARSGSASPISGDGGTALVGGRTDAAGAGAAWVFTHDESGWTQQGPKLTASDGSGAANFGYSTALSANGTSR